MTTTTPKKWASRMEGVMRRASAVFVNPARPGNSTDINAASTTGKKPKRSRKNTSLSNIMTFTRSASPPPRAPIAESPTREDPAYQEETITLPATGASKSPLTQRVKLTGDPNHAALKPRTAPINIPQKRGTFSDHLRSSLGEDNDGGQWIVEGTPMEIPSGSLGREVTFSRNYVKVFPNHAAATAPQPQTAGASPTLAEYIPPPLIDNTATGPGPFTDDLDKLPPSDPLALYRSRSRSRSQEAEPVQREAAQQTDLRSLNPMVQNTADLPVGSNGGEQEGRADKSAPIDTPQKTRIWAVFGSSLEEEEGAEGTPTSIPSRPSLARLKTGNPSSYTIFTSPTLPLSSPSTFTEHEAATPPRLRENGWVETQLPDSCVYYVNPAARIVADVEMRNDRLFYAVSKHLELEQHKDALDSAPEGAELWLRDAGSVKKGFVPVRWWVVHKEREVVFDKAFEGGINSKVLKKEDQLDLEYSYWAFVEAHPSHIVLEARAKREAYEAINWAMTDRFFRDKLLVFSQEECGTLLDLLNLFDNDENRQVDTAIQTRTIARILLRVSQWHQQHFHPNKPLPKDVTAQTARAPVLYSQDDNTFESEATAEYTELDFPVPLPTESLQEMLKSLTATLNELRTVGRPMDNKDTISRLCKVLNLSDATIASEVTASDAELLVDFLLLTLRMGTLANWSRVTRKARRLMFRLISKIDTVPRSLFITNVEKDSSAIAMGGYGNVFEGKHNGQLVALKVLYKGHYEDSIEKDLIREAIPWGSLSHHFILPLLGIYAENSRLFLVSPFMMNGTLRQWRKRHNSVRMDEIHRLLLEVAEGFEYIHSQGIVHGDLHGGNVLLDSENHCQITDFGSARHFEAIVTHSTTALFFSFAAPELFGACPKCGEPECDKCYEDPNEQHKCKTMKTDVYAFGCLYYATFFDTTPFQEKKGFFEIMRAVLSGARPRRPENPRMEDDTWNLLQRCWERSPSERPPMGRIVAMLTPPPVNHLSRWADP